mmetsp:Transcript_46858/g.130181  ORF Transcript_46858/g.130181 Transcript_46858/m.130181 type:complete len:254 (+) Transcript_46858:437-1198(+)
MRPIHPKCRSPRGPSCTYPIRPTVPTCHAPAQATCRHHNNLERLQRTGNRNCLREKPTTRSSLPSWRLVVSVLVFNRVHQFSSLEPAAQQAADKDECNASRRRPYRHVQLALEIAFDDEILRALVVGPRRIQIRFLVQLDHTGAYLISSHELILVGAVEAFKIEGAIAVHPLVDLRMPFLSPQLVQLGSSRLRLLVCSINSTVWARRVFVPQITQRDARHGIVAEGDAQELLHLVSVLGRIQARDGELGDVHG